jgi:hypothetical protein
MPLLEPTVKRYSDVQANGLVDIPLLIDESYELILELTQFYPLTTIVIDALDECDLENQSKLLDFLANIIQKSTNLVKVFISSRDDAHIKQRLRDCPNIEVNGRRNGDDIAKFVKVDVEKRIQDNRLLCLSESTSQGDLKKLLIDEVIEGADGM